jgi:response regulator RpfG family c-di-GMP phosphodiesterase
VEPAICLTRQLEDPSHQPFGDYIRDQRGALFDPTMVEALLDIAPYRSIAAG